MSNTLVQKKIKEHKHVGIKENVNFLALKNRYCAIPDTECSQLQNIQSHEDAKETTDIKTKVITKQGFKVIMQFLIQTKQN